MKPERHKAFNPAQIAQHVDHGNNPTHQAGQDKGTMTKAHLAGSLGILPMMVGRCFESMLTLLLFQSG